jgi:hypothetical protein
MPSSARADRRVNRPSTSSTGNRCSASGGHLRRQLGRQQGQLVFLAEQQVSALSVIVNHALHLGAARHPENARQRQARGQRDQAVRCALLQPLHRPGRSTARAGRGGMQARSRWGSGLVVHEGTPRVQRWVRCARQGAGAQQQRDRVRAGRRRGRLARPGRRRLPKWRPQRRRPAARSPRAAGAPIARRRAGASAARLRPARAGRYPRASRRAGIATGR